MAQAGLVETKVIDPARINNAVLAYLKVGGRSPPDADKMEKTVKLASQVAASPLKENRAAGMTCRTWLLQVLEVLKGEGFLVRENNIEGIEDRVREIRKQEQKLIDGSHFVCRKV